jgi:hypothetical protein
MDSCGTQPQCRSQGFVKGKELEWHLSFGGPCIGSNLFFWDVTTHFAEPNSAWIRADIP